MSIENVVKSAARVLEVFEFFAQRRAAASVSDVCSALGYPQSSTSVLLKSLLTLGYLSYDTASRRYIPTHRVALLGNWLPDAASELPALLRSLHEETRAIAFLGQLNGARVQWLQSADESSTGRAAADRGDRESVVRTAAGRVLLSTLSDGHVLRIVRRANAQEGPRVDERALLDSLADIRRDGYAVSEDPDTGTAQIAVLANESTGVTPLAIGLVVPLARFAGERDALVAALQESTSGSDVTPSGSDYPVSTATTYGGGLVAGYAQRS